MAGFYPTKETNNNGSGGVQSLHQMEDNMSCRIIIDTGGEYTEIMQGDAAYASAPLRIRFPEVELIDDGTIVQQDLLNMIESHDEVPRSSCPSPEEYMNLYNCDEDNVYAITISAQVSGSYNSAVLGKNLFEEEHGEKNIHVFNSKSASVGMSTVAYKIKEFEDAGCTFKEVIEKVEAFIEELHLYFVLENLETLKKNGRLTGVKSAMVSALNIKPVMTVDKVGDIISCTQGRGMKKALVKMVEKAVEEVVDPETKIVGIAHCNDPERAEYVKQLVLERIKVKEVFIAETSGLSTMYANQGGILLSM